MNTKTLPVPSLALTPSGQTSCEAVQLRALRKEWE